jgi:hypothetical protein
MNYRKLVFWGTFCYNQRIITMLTPHLQSRFIEKVLTDRAGRQFRVLFLVSLVNGEVRGQIVSAQPIFETAKTASLPGRVYKGSPCTKLCLPCTKAAAKIIESKVRPWSRVASPYYSSLEFFMSQPTRAPSV